MASRAEKRLARKQLKLEKELRKKTQQVADPSPSKSPINLPVAAGKLIPDTPLRDLDRLMEYSSDHEDREGAWSWGQLRDWGEETWNGVLAPFVDDCCKKQWRDIDNEKANGKKKHIFYQRGTIIKEARKRLIELQKDDLEERLFRFRLNGRNRFYGFRMEHIFYALWWDPEHRIFPSKKKGT